MQIASDKADPLAMRWYHYSTEQARLQERLQSGDLPSEKRQRLMRRLSDLELRLMPALRKELQASLW